jgi:S1-C subfamily serine protease
VIRPAAPAAGAVLLLLAASAAAPQEAGGALETLDREARALFERLSPSVVRVEFERTPRFRVTAGSDAERERIEARLRAYGPREIVAASGFVVEEPGLVATASAGCGGATAIRVLGPAGAAREAALVGSDDLAGVALLRVAPATGEVPLRWSERAPSPATLALLLAPEERGPASVLRLGFVTVPRRAFGLYDAWLVAGVPVEPGQVGAPLLDAAGGVLGMAVTAREKSRRLFGAPGGLPGAAPVSGEPGGGGELVRRLTEFTVERQAPFSTFVPSAELRRIVADLRSHGRVRRAMLGVRLLPGEPVVREVVAGTPAEARGVAVGDRVLSLDGTPVEDRETLTAFLQRRAPGTAVSLRVRGEDGTERAIDATLGELPAPPPARQLFNGISVAARASYDTAAARIPVGAVPSGSWIVVASVDEGSAAARAGLRAGDWIVEIEGRPILSQADFDAATTGPAALADSVEMLVYRAGEAERRTLVLR